MALFENLSSRLTRITDAMRGKSRVTEKDIKDMMHRIIVSVEQFTSFRGFAWCPLGSLHHQCVGRIHFGFQLFNAGLVD